jgi:hypothetical protein
MHGNSTDHGCTHSPRRAWSFRNALQLPAARHTEIDGDHLGLRDSTSLAAAYTFPAVLLECSTDGVTLPPGSEGAKQKDEHDGLHGELHANMCAEENWYRVIGQDEMLPDIYMYAERASDVAYNSVRLVRDFVLMRGNWYRS